MNHRIERLSVAAVAVGIGLQPIVHALAAALRGPDGPVAAVALAVLPSLSTVAGALALLLGARGVPAVLGALAAGVAGCLWPLALGDVGAAAVVAASAPLAMLAVAWFAVHLPASLDGALGRRPVRSAAWLVAGLLAVAQTGRISAFHSDPALEHGPVLSNYFAHHMCLPAYLYAVELHDRGEENVYASHHYPGVHREARPETAIDGMSAYVEDPFQYPPQFLLIPRAILAVTNDYMAIRMGWFVAQALLFAGVGIAVARWVGGRRGLAAGLLLPIVWMSFPTMFNFQYGQFHLVAIVAAVAGMFAFERGRHATGGALLAASVVSKLFPALLLVPLAVQRRWRALGWTASFSLGYTLLALGVFGAAPFEAFLVEHMPRLSSGAAFAFAEAWPEISAELAAANQSPVGLAQKLAELGIHVPASGVSVLNGAFTVAILAVALLAGRRSTTRAGRVQTWLALLGLASMRSPGAWADYVVVSSLWMLTFVDPGAWASRGRAVALATAWVFLFFLPGILPLPVFPPVGVMMALAIVGFAIAITVHVWGVLAAPVREVAGEEPAVGRALAAT